jgi:hypothetical protein
MSDHDRQYDYARFRQLLESRLHRRELGIDLDQVTAMAVLGDEEALSREFAASSESSSRQRSVFLLCS